MPKLRFTQALKRFFPNLDNIEVGGEDIAEALEHMDQQIPGLRDYIVDDQGRLRQHVNIFIGEVMIKDKVTLRDKIQPDDTIYIFQALSGG